MKWTEKYKINTHDTDMNGIVSATGLQRYFQDCANTAMEKTGPSYDELFASGLSFILSRIRTEMYEPLFSHDEVEIDTWACPGRGVIFPRCYEVRKNGRIAAQSVSQWALINTESHSFVKNGELETKYFFDEPLRMDMPARLRLPQNIELSPAGERTTCYADVDRNGHMNNTRYPDILLGCLDMKNKRAAVSDISFISEAPLGEKLTLMSGVVQDGSAYYFRTIRVDGKTNVEAMFTLEPVRRI